ncbi:PREDICTED: cyclic GMP-AMP synthase-like [Trachymyrmex cornetzi]|uniref:cyclic GMP-AMP synthase-like n=1 Tax=Trachymyrmex cornetzi TaxID=471704 RepID=UPI00084F563F|nr:PREDICTED: cyclic GMP-AMP synthase-like [Trachymyrmex cornetzi]
MTQVEDISRYLSNDTVFNKISRRFISMQSDDIRRNNELLNSLLKELENAMRSQCPLFTKTFKKIEWAGSYYKGTRVGQPEEYDLNFVIKLPFRENDLEFSTDRPGFTKIRIVGRDRNSSNTLNMDPAAYRKLNSFIDDQSYLNQQRFRTWIEGILDKVAWATGGNNEILFDGYLPIKIKKSGPAFTLLIPLFERTISIDIVPVLAFSPRITMPPKCSRRDILESASENRRWSVVPKPLDNSKGFNDSQHRYWRLCFYEFEKVMICSHDYGSIKPVIRQLKKLRDTQKWCSIASYYLETLCYNKKEIFHISKRQSYTSLFFTMLEELHDALCNGKIEFYWDNDYNLLEKIGPEEMRNMAGRLNNVLESIRKNIKNDQYAIARWILNKNELDILINSVHVLEPEPEPEPEPEFENPSQWNCVIV